MQISLELRGQGVDIWDLCQNPYLIKGVVVHTNPDYIIEAGEVRPVLGRVAVNAGNKITCGNCTAHFHNAHGLQVWSRSSGLMVVTQCLFCGSYTWLDLGPKRGESPEQFIARMSDEAERRKQFGLADAEHAQQLADLLRRHTTPEQVWNILEEHGRTS